LPNIEVIALKYKLTLLIILIAVTSTVAAQGFWRRLPAPPFASAVAEAVVGTGDNFYVLRSDGETEPELWWYAAETREWSLVNASGLDIGELRPGTSLAWDGDETLYALGGGVDDDDLRALYRISLTNPRRATWERMADTPHSQGDGNALVWDHTGERLYALMGSQELGGAFAIYDPNRNHWDELTFPAEWGCIGPGTSLVSLGLFGVYALQGQCNSSLLEETRFSFYSPFSLRWEPRANFPDVNDAGGSMLWFGHLNLSQSVLIYALSGGLDGAPGANTYRFNLDNGRWNQLAAQFCAVGGYVGNRLGYVDEAVHVWQGSPDTFSCGGSAFLQLLGIDI
jgi:hypothetical protein